MKRIFTLACVAAMAATSFAQTQQSGFVDTKALGLEGTDKNSAVSKDAGTVVASSTNVSMKLAFADTWQESSLTAESDIANQVVIDGTTYSMVKGIQGETNPKPLGFQGGQNQGAVFQFDVTEDGYLYVIGKFTGNKQYYVWGGDVANAAGVPMAYTFIGQPSKVAGVVKVSLPADPDGLYTVGSGYDKTIDGLAVLATISLCADGPDAITAALDAGNDITKSFGTVWTTEGGNALGVLAFPVQSGVSYFVNATGSKLTANGFVFIPKATSLGTVSFTKNADSGSDAIKDITIDDLDENAPVYNVLGQRVQKGYKGICIQNGKKFIVK